MEGVVGWDRVEILVSTIIIGGRGFNVNDDRVSLVGGIWRSLVSSLSDGFRLNSWNGVIMGLTGILRQEFLEDVAEAPRIVISPIRTMEVELYTYCKAYP